MSTQPIAPMTLGDIFDRLFKLIGKTWLRNLIIASVILIIPVLMMAFSMNGFLSAVARMAEEQNYGDEFATPGFVELLGHIAVFILGLLIFLFATAAARLGITIVSCAEVVGEPLDWREALGRSFGVRYARIIGASVLTALAIGGLVGIPYIVIIVAIAVRSIVLGLLGGLSLLILGCLAVYIGIRWSFLVPAVAWEDLGVMASFRRSWSLVENNWWRVLGILLLMGIITSFVVSLVLAPVYVVAFLSFFAGMFSHLGNMQSEQESPRIILDGIRSFGFGIGLLSGISSILQLLISPLYVVILYFDLRARKGEFQTQTPPHEVTV
ncbi:MAG TPA: glycerophosphoryl diester phosphodiesterase membrane domain-containing protein [Bacteroidota bacterium]|nr:glycerophosphoryl diester phosphodiesterase membrane domain-containing protein [Bacteroidota bacterium]